MNASDINENYLSLFKDIDQSINKQFEKANISFQIVGYVALAFAGLPANRETKDVDTIKTEALSSSQNAPIIKFLEDEFGKKSPGLYRHGMWLDFVSSSIIWLPPKPKFIKICKFQNISLSRLDPVDTCVSKLFSFVKSGAKRSNDMSDITLSLDNQIVNFEKLIGRIVQALPRYEAHAEAPEAHPKLLKLIKERLIPKYNSTLSLDYKLPNWMENA